MTARPGLLLALLLCAGAARADEAGVVSKAKSLIAGLPHLGAELKKAAASTPAEFAPIVEADRGGSYSGGRISLSRGELAEADKALGKAGFSEAERERGLAVLYVPVLAHEAQHAANQLATDCRQPVKEDEWSARITEVEAYLEMKAWCAEPRNKGGAYCVKDAYGPNSDLALNRLDLSSTYELTGPDGMMDFVVEERYARLPSIGDGPAMTRLKGDVERNVAALEKHLAACGGKDDEACRELLSRKSKGGIKTLARGRELLKSGKDLLASACWTEAGRAKALSYYRAERARGRAVWCRHYPASCGD